MNILRNSSMKVGAALLCALLGSAVANTLWAQSPPPPVPPAGAASTNAAGSSVTDTNAANPEEIQLSFQGANIDMVVQWLSQQTGKSVMKHPQAQCQLTITSSKKVPVRQAIDLVYKALALEGYTAIESANLIQIVKEGQEPKMAPELLSASATNVPDGRQRLVKMFPLAHAQASDLRERVRVVLSEKGTVDVDDRGNQLIVTDYNDNLRLLTVLMKELDVTASSDFTLQVYPLKFGEAEDIGNLISMILNAQSPPPPTPGRPGSSSSRSSSSSPSMAMVIGGMSDSGSSSSGSGGSGGGALPPSQQVRIWSDKTANRLIVSSPRSKLPEIERLIGVLDTRKPEDVSVRVLPLKNMNALDLIKQIGPLYKSMSGKSLKEMIELSADDQSNSLIVLSSEANFRNIERLVRTLDTEGAQEKITRTFSLKNADAQDVAKQIQDLSQDSSVQARYIYFFDSAPAGKNKKPTVVADRRRNAVIVQAPPLQMDDIEKMIDQLDAPVSDGSLAPQIFPLKYVSAVDMEEVLNELFLKRQQQRSYFDDYYSFFYGGSSQNNAGSDVGRLYGKVRITSEPNANVIIVTANSRENLVVVGDMIRQLDAPSESGDSTFWRRLKFAKADAVAKSLNILFAKTGSPGLGAPTQQQQQRGAPPPGGQQQNQASSPQSGFDLEQDAREDAYYPWLGGSPDNSRSASGRLARPPSELIDRIRVVPDLPSNSLLISANVHFLPQILKLIEDMDSPPDQVLIEARIIEVASDFMDKLGVRWSPDGSSFTPDDLDNGIVVKTSTDYKQGFGGKTIVNNPGTAFPAPDAATSANLLASIRSGVVSSTISLDFLIQFLKKTTDATVLAEPQINIRDNETGRLFVGQQVPIQTASQNSGSIGLSQTFAYKNVGVILEVTPHINNSGDVELKIHAESSTVVPGVTVLGGAVFDTRTFRTDLRARNGQTLVLGGIIQKQLSDTLRKTPVLGNIPGLGWAFKKKDKTSREVELMVFLRPKVVRTEEEALELMNEIDRKTPLLKRWQSETPPTAEDHMDKLDEQQKKTEEEKPKK
jgi:type II secretion system protein D